MSGEPVELWPNMVLLYLKVWGEILCGVVSQIVLGDPGMKSFKKSLHGICAY